MIILMAAPTGDSVLSIACVVAVALIGFSVTQAIGRLVDRINAINVRVGDLALRVDGDIDEVYGDLQDHKTRCHVDTNAVLTKQVQTNEKEIASLRRYTHWIGNCLQVLFQKVPGAEIPPRND